jgi:hypothetical protein
MLVAASALADMPTTERSVTRAGRNEAEAKIGALPPCPIKEADICCGEGHPQALECEGEAPALGQSYASEMAFGVENIEFNEGTAVALRPLRADLVESPMTGPTERGSFWRCGACIFLSGNGAKYAALVERAKKVGAIPA